MSETLHDCVAWALDARAKSARPVAVCFAADDDDQARAWTDVVVPGQWEHRLAPIARWAEWAAHPPEDADGVFIVAPFLRIHDIEDSASADLRAEG